MNLVIDVGNTSLKLGVFEKNVLLYASRHKIINFMESIYGIKEAFPFIQEVILCAVSNLEQIEVAGLQELFPTIILDHETKMPFINLYATPKTLGMDRLALIAAAVGKFPKKNVLVIDAGTCITFDFKNKKEEYLGGAIAPGIHLRYKSLHGYTSKLPLLQPKLPVSKIGKTTEEAIHTGVVQGVLYEIQGSIADYCNIYADLTVILTGGDAHFLSKRLKNSIFATSNFLLEGLNHILAFNTGR